jgi:parallel beta-helix repeat protein
MLFLLVGPALGYTLPATNMSGDINFRSYNASNMNALTFDTAGPDIDLNGRKFTDGANGTAGQDLVTYSQLVDSMPVDSISSVDWTIFYAGSSVYVSNSTSHVVYTGVSGSNDATALQYCFDNVTEDENVIVVRNKLYPTSTATIRNDWTVLRDAVVYGNVDNGSVIAIGSAMGAKIEDCVIGNTHRSTNYTVYDSGMSRGSVVNTEIFSNVVSSSNLSLKECGNSYWNTYENVYCIGGVLFSSTTDNNIHNMDIHGYYTNYPLIIDATSAHNYFSDCHFITSTHYIDWYHSGVEVLGTNTHFVNCEFDGGYPGDGRSGGLYIYGNSNVVQACSFYNWYGRGIYIYDSRGCKISDCDFVNCNYGNSYASDIQLSGSACLNNTIRGTQHSQSISRANKGGWVKEVSYGSGAPNYNLIDLPMGLIANYDTTVTKIGAQSSWRTA